MSNRPTKAGSLDHIAQIQAELQSRRLHYHSRHCDPVLGRPCCEEVLMHICTVLPMLQFVAVSPCAISMNR